MTLPEGVSAPDFSLNDKDDLPHSLNDYQGQKVLLYFYPKDHTPGCTTEACNFRDDFSKYQESSITILGISPDSSRTHANFQAKHNLPFTLLSDKDHQICELYNVWGPKKFMGREYEGVHRTTYLINEQGIIQKVFKKVKPANHSNDVLAWLNKL